MGSKEWKLKKSNNVEKNEEAGRKNKEWCCNQKNRKKEK